MINLLPPENKKELAGEENWKIIMIFGFLIFVFFICLSLVLFSIKFFIAGEVEAQKILFEQKQKEFQSPQMQALQDNLINFNQTLVKLESFYQGQSKTSDILKKISLLVPSGVFINNLSMNFQPKNQGEWQMVFNLSGFSPSREKLLEFKDRLEKEPLFKEANFPSSNWMKSDNIDFNINFKLE